MRRGFTTVVGGCLLGVASISACSQGGPVPPPKAGTGAPAQTTGPAQTTAPASPAVSKSAAPARQVAVYALSRGQGVPPATREARQKARALFQQWRAQGKVLEAPLETPMGLEGERRICATFANEHEAADAAKQLRALGEGVELFNVVEEPCAQPPGTPIKK